MSIATTLARIVRPRRDGDPPDSATWARVLVPVLAGVALLFTFRGGTTLVTLLLMAYSMVTQLFPPLLASLMPAARITAGGAIAGILAGEAAVAANTIGGLSMPALLPQWPHAVTDINAGFLAVILNVVTMVLVSRLSSRIAAPVSP
jgi:SSS family solute:Na+ symporter